MLRLLPRGIADPRGGVPRVCARALWLGATLAAALPAAGQRFTMACRDCHIRQSEQFDESVHRAALDCRDCHGGQRSYELTAEQARVWRAWAPGKQPSPPPEPFDHGEGFRGKPGRADVPVFCGTCHADIERMNPYGLRTDQLAAYWTSGHGRTLARTGDTRVAVCIDCHGSHDILPRDNPRSRTHFARVPETCARCHEDRALMRDFNLPAEIPEQYRRSIHGRNVLEGGDAGSPNCATCHGSHGAAPPGVAQVGHVCGKCHQQIEDYLVQSVHGRIAVVARCTGCHGKGGDRLNHQIEPPHLNPEELVRLYTELAGEIEADGERLGEAFRERLDNDPRLLTLPRACGYCHGARRRDPHEPFFSGVDADALDLGRTLQSMLRDAELTYVRTAERVERLARGVLLVRDEAMRLQDARTELVALYAQMHSLNRVEIAKRISGLKDICTEIHAGLDEKETSLVRRRQALYVGWVFIGVFVTLMYRKYRLLRAAYVWPMTPDGRPAPEPEPVAVGPTRRWLLDRSLQLMGLATLGALLWPAVRYVLPARRRGGASEHVSAGKAEGWKPWEVRKVSVAGKPVAVLRTDKDFRAFSLVCTHLGCIVHWNAAGKEFDCPCHAARFDSSGQVLAGPPPRPLVQYAVSVVQGEVIVRGSEQA